MLLSNIKPPIQEEEEIKQCCRRFFSFSPPTPPHSTVCSVTCTRNGKGCDEWQLTVRESDRRTKCGPAVSRPSARARSHPNQRQAKGNRHVTKKKREKSKQPLCTNNNKKEGNASLFVIQTTPFPSPKPVPLRAALHIRLGLCLPPPAHTPPPTPSLCRFFPTTVAAAPPPLSPFRRLLPTSVSPLHFPSSKKTK